MYIVHHESYRPYSLVPRLSPLAIIKFLCECNIKGQIIKHGMRVYACVHTCSDCGNGIRFGRWLRQVRDGFEERHTCNTDSIYTDQNVES